MSGLILEFSEKLIKDLVAKFKDDASEKTVRSLVDEFSKRQNALGTIKGVVIPDRLKDNNQYKDITKYTFDELNTLVRSFPVDEKKLKANAVDYYVDKERIDKGTAQFYVNRYFRSKAELKALLKSSDKEERENTLQYIPKKLQQRDLYLSISNWDKFTELEQMLDALFPVKGASKKDETNSADIDADKIFSKGNIEVYIGDEQHKCIKYGKGDYYNWCIIKSGSQNMYFNYRFSNYGENRMFYVVIDRSRTDKKKDDGRYFVDPWHCFVIHVGEQGTYWVSDADNREDKKVSSWDELGKYIPQDIWSVLKGMQDKFVFVPPTKGEVLSQGLKGKRLSVNDFNRLDYDEKEAYITVNAQSKLITKELFDSLDTTLKLKAINSGRVCSYEELKNNPGLAKRYAIVRMRHEIYSKTPIPLPFIKYLDPKGQNSQEEYLKKFDDDYLDYDAIEKYFDKDIVKEYVSEKVKNFDYLPKEAKKYMDSKEKALYDIYSIPFTDTNLKVIDDSTIESGYDVPVRTGTIFSTSNESFTDIDPKNRENYIKMLKTLMKDKGNLDKYNVLFLGVPITFNIKNKLYFFAPVDRNTKSVSSNQEYCFYDENGDVKIKGLSSYLDLLKDGTPLRKTALGLTGSDSIYISDTDFTDIVLKDRTGDVKRITKDQFIKMLNK